MNCGQRALQAAQRRILGDQGALWHWKMRAPKSGQRALWAAQRRILGDQRALCHWNMRAAELPLAHERRPADYKAWPGLLKHGAWIAKRRSLSSKTRSLDYWKTEPGLLKGGAWVLKHGAWITKRRSLSAKTRGLTVRKEGNFWNTEPEVLKHGAWITKTRSLWGLAPCFSNICFSMQLKVPAGCRLCASGSSAALIF